MKISSFRVPVHMLLVGGEVERRVIELPGWIFGSIFLVSYESSGGPFYY